MTIGDEMYPFEMMIDYLRDLILCLNVAASYTARIRGGKKRQTGSERARLARGLAGQM